MILVDSSGWIEYYVNGALAERYASYLSSSKEVLTPSVVLYEVYKILKSRAGKEEALLAAAQMGETNVVWLSDSLAYQAADISIKYGLPMADSIIYATAVDHGVKLVTSDADFKELPNVLYLDPENEKDL